MCVFGIFVCVCVFFLVETVIRDIVSVCYACGTFVRMCACEYVYVCVCMCRQLAQVCPLVGVDATYIFCVRGRLYLGAVPD